MAAILPMRLVVNLLRGMLPRRVSLSLYGGYPPDELVLVELLELRVPVHPLVQPFNRSLVDWYLLSPIELYITPHGVGTWHRIISL